MKTEIKILKKIKEPTTIRQLSKLIKADYRITHTAVQRLIKKGLLKTKSIGNSKLCERTNKFSIELIQAEEEKIQSLPKNIQQLRKEILEVKEIFFIALLFGSYAKGTANKNSDIDLLFIANKGFEEKIKEILNILPMKIHTIFLTEKEFRKLSDEKGENLINEVNKNSIVLYGIEQYYKIRKS